MKSLIFITLISLFVSVQVQAAETCEAQPTTALVSESTTEITTDVPAYLKGATITVTLPNGSSYSMSADTYKVVPRQQQFIVTKVETNKVTKCTITAEEKRNRISLLGGNGIQDGLDRDESQAPTVTISNKTGAVVGLQYQYKTDAKLLKMPVSVGVQGQSNKTGTLLLGLDF